MQVVLVGVGNAKLYGIQGHATLEDCQDGTHLFVNAGDEGGGEVPDVVRSEARVGLVLVEGGVGTTFGERGVLDDGAVQVVVVAGCFGFCEGGAGGFGFSGQRRHVVRGEAMRNRSIWNTCGVGGWGEALVSYPTNNPSPSEDLSKNMIIKRGHLLLF